MNGVTLSDGQSCSGRGTASRTHHSGRQQRLCMGHDEACWAVSTGRIVGSTERYALTIDSMIFLFYNNSV